MKNMSPGKQKISVLVPIYNYLHRGPIEKPSQEELKIIYSYENEICLR